MGDAHNLRRALVLYGSETGNAQDVAEEMGRLAERLRFDTEVAELNAVSLVCQAQQEPARAAVDLHAEAIAAARRRSDLHIHHRPGRSATEQPGLLEGTA